MCGICGVYEYGAGEPRLSESLVASMRDTMTHRGPDDAGVYLNGDRRVGLGNRRLAIVDLSPAGRNPMSNEDGSIWITFNGEIYNHETLRRDLIARGHKYRSRTDTESIVHLYEECGLEFLDRLDGDFAIGLWDENRKRIVLARDRIGVKPLYYTISGGRLIFASEIKAILAHPAVSRDMDEEALYHYLTFLTAPAPQTLFAGINKLAAGTVLTCDSRGDIKITRYWDAIVSGPAGGPVGDEREVAGEVRRLLEQSIEKRMMSDVPFGVFLSGGIDSTANVALMARLMDRPVRTFTVGFRDNPDYNEIEEARDVAREYATDHHEVLIGEQELFDILPQMIFHQDEPIADPVCVPIYYVSKLARESGTKVIQVGEGSDELFCGYPDYTYYLGFHDYFWKYASRLPAGLRRLIAAGGQAAFTVAGRGLAPRWRKVAPDLFRRLADGEELFWSGAFIFDETSKRELLTSTARERIMRKSNGAKRGPSSHAIVRRDLDRLLAAKPEADMLERMTYLELKLRLAELLLMRVDKMTMAASVEARVPFLDPKLVEYALTIPRHLKYGGETKRILRRALAGVIPERVLRRKKKGFGAPLNEWMVGRLGRFTEDALFGSSLRRRDLFDYEFIKRLFAEQRAGRMNYSFFLWTLLNLSLWYEQWIETSGPAAAGIHQEVTIL